MSVPNLDSEVRKALQDMQRTCDRVIPVRVGKEVVSSIRQNFREGGFYGDKWKRTLRQTVPFKGAAGSYGPLLSRTAHLMSSTDYIPGKGRVTIRNTVPYAVYHNEGARTKVTEKMKRYFWAKYFNSTGIKKNDPADVKKSKRLKAPAEAEFWQAMALKKPGSTIVLPKRQFLGPSPKVDEIVTTTINNELEKYIKSI